MDGREFQPVVRFADHPEPCRQPKHALELKRGRSRGSPGYGTILEGDPMATPKQVAREILDRLPDDCSLDDIQYHLYVRRMIEEGRQEIRDGRYITQEQIEQDLAQWLEQ
jgi:hypothetical protein